MAERVWAAGPKIEGVWGPGHGWTMAMPAFSSLGNLISQMKDRNLKGIVSRLGIVAHGDSPGLIQLTGDFIPGFKDLTVSNLSHYASDLKELRLYLEPAGWLMFFSCIAGSGQQGDRLLSALSRLLPGRTIVGFTTYGWAPTLLGGAKIPAGDVYDAGYDQRSKRVDQKGKKPMTEWYKTAKWAKNGWIIRQPRDELDYYQNRLPEKRCGSIFCLGHKASGDMCDPYKRDPEREYIHFFGLLAMPVPKGRSYVRTRGGPTRKPGASGRPPAPTQKGMRGGARKGR